MKKTILIIEDDIDIRESAAELLTLEGFYVLQAASAEMGLTLLANGHPDLVICDILLSGMDGYEMLSRLRNNGNHVPFIFSTAMAENKDRRRGLELGATAYLIKPFDGGDLLGCIKNCLGTIN